MTEYNTYIPEKQYARPEVKSFSDIMEFQLRANDFKGGWYNEDPGSLFLQMEKCSTQLSTMLLERAHGAKLDAMDVMAKAADIANYAMMVADTTRRCYDVNGIREGLCKLSPQAPEGTA